MIPASRAGPRGTSRSKGPPKRASATTLPAIQRAEATGAATGTLLKGRADGTGKQTSDPEVLGAKATLKERLQQLRAGGLEMIERGEVKPGLAELARAINLRVANAAKLPKGDALWVYVEEYTLIANSEAVLRGAAAEAPSEVQAFFSEALRFIATPEDEPTEPGSSSAGKKTTVARTRTPRMRLPDYFAGNSELRGHLRALVIGNIATEQRHHEPLHKVVHLLLRALCASGGVLCLGVLYNLAAAFLACGRFDDAMEAIARCVELCQAYLGIEAPLPITELEAFTKGSSKEEVAERRRAERRMSAHGALITVSATHAIMCHHFIATFTAWCGGMEEMEVYHCQLAAGCAQTHLPPAHPLQKRCLNRLSAASARAAATAPTNSSNTSAPSGNTAPPQVPLVAQGEYMDVLTCVAAAEGRPGSATDDVSPTAVPLSQLVRTCSGAEIPAELRAYVESVVQFLRISGKGGASESTSLLPTLPRSAARQPRTVTNAGTRKRQSTSGSALLLATHDDKVVVEPAPADASEGDGESGASTALVPLFTPRPPTSSRRRSTAALECIPTPRYITKLSQPAFDRYQQLKSDTIRALHAQQLTATDISNSPAAAGPVPLASSPHPTTITAVDGTECTPAEFMHLMDKELRRFSKILPDDTPVRQDAAARKLQKRWRYFRARCEREQRAAAVEERVRQVDAALIICRKCRDWLDCRSSVRDRMVRRVLREKVRAVVLLQRYLRERESVEVWGERCLAHHEVLLQEKLQHEREVLSATVVQAWWRRFVAQERLRRVTHLMVRLQTAWRCFLARRELMVRRVHFRLAEEKRHRALLPQLIYIQRWWRAVTARRVVDGLLEMRKRLVLTHLETQEHHFNEQLERFRVMPDLGKCIRCILAVLRAARAREELRQLHARRLVVRRIVTYWVLRRRGREQLAQLRVERQQRRLLQRRREEVTWACVRIQSAARMWLAKAALQCLRQREQLLYDAVSAIGQAYRNYRDRRLLEARVLADGDRAAEAAVSAQTQEREYSSTLIQATWRGYRARRAQRTYLHFMLKDRHALAVRIQRLWKGHRGRMAAREQRAVVAVNASTQQREQRQRLAVMRLQSLVRMFITRARLLRTGAILPATVLWRHAAARTIQLRWRAFACCRHVAQLRLSRAYYDKEKTSQEALHAYATMIQSVVRGRLLNPLRVTQDRFHSPSMAAARRAAAASLEEVAAVSVRSSVSERSRGTASQQSSSQQTGEGDARVGHRTEDDDVTCTQTGNTIPVQETHTEESRTRVVYDEEHIAAAVLIQKIWRGYWVRQTYEYYYEEYEEEVYENTSDAAVRLWQ